jgi:hypothetical protein
MIQTSRGMVALKETPRSSTCIVKGVKGRFALALALAVIQSRTLTWRSGSVHYDGVPCTKKMRYCMTRFTDCEFHVPELELMRATSRICTSWQIKSNSRYNVKSFDRQVAEKVARLARH